VTTVLIVDDHPSFRSSAAALLAAEGFEVVGEAPDGDSAIALAKELCPDVVLLDVQLPDVDGFEVATTLCREQLAGRVVLVSSRDGSDFGPLVGDCGACGFLPKSELSGEKLAELIR
jgi:DNA-binding NarL/FixJ family response regulator